MSLLDHAAKKKCNALLVLLLPFLLYILSMAGTEDTILAMRGKSYIEWGKVPIQKGPQLPILCTCHISLNYLHSKKYFFHIEVIVFSCLRHNYMWVLIINLYSNSKSISIDVSPTDCFIYIATMKPCNKHCFQREANILSF